MTPVDPRAARTDAFLHPRAPRVKICGLTRPEDALDAIDAGADALGFNLWPGSKRFIPLASLLPWLRDLPAPRIAVVVNPSTDLLEEIRQAACFEAIQFHGDESASFCEAAGFPRWIRAERAESRERLEGLTAYATGTVLIDAHVPGAFGGTGQRADWDLVAEFRQRHPEKAVLLAGGLNPENVAAARRATGTLGVDVAGGVEHSPGRKDPERVRRFIDAAKF